MIFLSTVSGSPCRACAPARRQSSPAATSIRCCSPNGWPSSLKLLIVDEPTRGVDVGARSEIYRLLQSRLPTAAWRFVVVSSDLPEVLALADRIIVMAEGNTVGEFAGRHRD